MFTEPAIIGNPELGLTESVYPDTAVTDNRTEGRGIPYIEPRENAPHDDANRINHAFKKIDEDISNILLADLIGIPAHLLTD